MNIWLIMSGEPLEMFGERPHRIGILSKMLVDEGHQVTWWTTTYDHQHKKYFFHEDTEMKSNSGVKMFFLHPRMPYKKNISFQRIINYKQVSLKFKKHSEMKEKPDLILCAFPSIDLSCSNGRNLAEPAGQQGMRPFRRRGNRCPVSRIWQRYVDLSD